MNDDVELDYDYLMQKALRGVLRDVLGMVAELGDAPGEHHFYIEFLTKAPGVKIPDYLQEEYPERMTIVLQHQFENLSVEERGFSVTLWFKGKEAPLDIPFDAVTSFADPSVQFGLRFERAQDDAEEGGPEDKDGKTSQDKQPSKEPAEKGGQKDGDSADVVNLDAFRKK